MRSSNPDLQPSNRNRLPFWVKPAIIGGLAVAALAGCAPGEATQPEQAVNTSPSPEVTEPSPEATEPTPTADRYEGSDFERTDPLPAELAEADSATPEEFALLPKSVQIQWATWAGQYKEEFVALFIAVSIEANDAPYTITTNSDAKALLLDRAYQLRIAENFGQGNPTSIETNGLSDKIMAEKYITAFTVVNEESGAKIDIFVDNLGDNDGRATNVVQQAARGDYDTLKEISESQDFSATTNLMAVDGKPIPCFRVRWTAADGSSTSNYNIGAYSTVDYKNQPIVVAVVSH